MPAQPVGPAARYFDDLEVGEQFRTQGRTVSHVEGSMWAMFTGDMNPMHVDEAFAGEYGPFEGRFPPGLMLVAIASGLTERLGLFVGTGVVMTGQTIRYHRAVLPGDTVHVDLTVLKKAPHPRRAAGFVDFGYEVATADGTVCIDGEWTIMLITRDA